MKLTIKLKIVALGAVLSIFVTAIALVFSNIEYRQHGKENQLKNIDKWLDNMSSDFTDETYGEDYLKIVQATRSYIEEN